MKKSTPFRCLLVFDKIKKQLPTLIRSVPLLTILMLAAISQTATAQTKRYVKAGASGNGSSWDAASGDLQAMINASSGGDQVWVAKGTYKPTTGTDRNISFIMKEGVGIYGGFAGTEASMTQRTEITFSNPSATILSGEIGEPDYTNDNSYHVICNINNNLTTTAVLDGFVITGGYANANFQVIYYGNHGGGILNYQAYPTFRNCYFMGNYATNGGAVANVSVSNNTLIENSRFVNNSAVNQGGALYGISSNFKAVNCSFNGNQATEGGAAHSYSSTMNFINCSFNGNTTSFTTSGVIHLDGNSAGYLSNCILWGNWGNFGLASKSIIKSQGASDHVTNSDVNQAEYEGQNGNIRQDPLFVNTANGDLRLKSYSPAINKGNSAANTTSLDLDGKPRIFGPAIDMGAFELQEAPCVPPTITGQPTAATKCIMEGVTFSVTATGTDLNYLWQKNGTDIPGATGSRYDIAAVSEGDAADYSVKVSGACGSPVTSTKASLIVNFPPQAKITPGGSTTICPNGSVILTASEGASYAWSEGSIDRSINVTRTGSYSVTITSPEGCSASSVPTTVTVADTEAPVAGDLPVIHAECFASVFPVNGTDNCAGSVVPTTNDPLLYNAQGTYTVHWTYDDGNGNSITKEQTVIIKDVTKPVPDITTLPNLTGCSATAIRPTAMDNCAGTITAITSDPLTYTAPGDYTIHWAYDDGNGNVSTQTQKVSIGAFLKPFLFISGATTFCEGGSVTLSAPSGFASYKWSNNATGSSITVNTGGTYSVTVNNGNGCSSTSDLVTVTVNPNPAKPVITASGATTFCEGGSVTLSAPSNFAAYKWSNNATGSSITVNTGGTYSVTVNNGNGCSSTSDLVTVTVNPGPAKPVITASGATTFCEGGSVTLSAPSGFASYKWSNNATGSSITVNAGGAYYVTVTNASGCSSVSDPVTVTVNPGPAKPVITASGATSLCQGGSVALSAPGGFASYKWSNNATASSITVNAAGSYKVTVTNASGCSSPASDAVTVAVLADKQKPVLICPATVTLCYATNEIYTIAPLQATDNCTIAGISYAITGATSRSGSGANASGVFKAGTSTITWTVKDAAGNIGTSKTSVVINPKLTVTVPDGWALGSGCVVNTVYKGYTPASLITLIAVPSGGKAPYTYKWSNGATAPLIVVNPSSPTTYTVTIKDASGCTQTASKAVNVVDVRCGSKLDMVSLCFNGKTICSASKEVAGYLLKGAYISSCKITALSRLITEDAERPTAGTDFNISASPNPSTNFFRLVVNSSNLKDKIKVIIADELGRIVETRFVFAGNTLQIGGPYHAGMYFVQATQGNKSISVKVIKQAW